MPDNGQTDTAGPASQAIIEAQQQGMNDMDSLSKKLPSGSDFLIAYATVPGELPPPSPHHYCIRTYG